MVEVSKHLFDSTYADIHCGKILHPWHENCFKAILPIYMHSIPGSAKFYAIIYAAQIAMRGKKMLKKEQWVKMGEYYLRSTLLGVIVCSTAPTISCFLRYIQGKRFSYYSFALIPFTLNGLSIYLEPPSRRGLVVNLFCNLLIEYWLRTLQKAGFIAITKERQTLLFMLGSSLLFYLMRLEGDKTEKTPLFWLFTPDKVRKKTNDDCDQSPCPHKGSCLKYITQGTYKYFGVGVAISLARLILPRLGSPMKALSSIRGRHFKLGLFFGSYIGIYRAVICLLCRKQGYDSALYALPAGYLAGISFLFNPSIGLAIASLTGAFKLYSTILYEKKLIPTCVPLPELLYCISQGILFHARLMHEDCCPGYVVNLMRSVSGGKSEQIHESFFKILRP